MHAYMPARKLQRGRKEYGVEDEAGNVLIEPSATTKSSTRTAAARLANDRGESVYMFEVGKDSDGTSIVVAREELRPQTPITPSHIRELQKKHHSLQSRLLAERSGQKSSSRDGAKKRIPAVALGDTKVDKWFERDRAHVALLNKKTGDTLIDFWDSNISELVEDGFLNPRDWHGSLYAYALHLGAIRPR